MEVANRVGVLEYCATRKHASAENIAHARLVLSHRATLPPRAELDQAEELGRGGTALAAGGHYPLAELGRLQHQSVNEVCDGIATGVDIAAEMLVR